MTDNDGGGLKKRLLEEVQDLDKMNDNNISRKSNEINHESDEEDKKEPIENEPYTSPPQHQFLNLGELPPGASVEQWLMEEQYLVPNSTRKALIAKWDHEKRIHILNEHDRKELEKRGLLEKWDNTANEISIDKRKQPMNNQPPFHYRFLWGSLRLFSLMILLYLELIISQIFLMNVVIIGICVWFHLKTMVFTNGMIKNKMYSYRHRLFKRFISEQTAIFSPVELIPGKEGKWIEIKLEEDENDSQPEVTYGFAPNRLLEPDEDAKKQD